MFWDRKTGRWRSQLGYNNRKIFMGYFNTPEEAAQAYDQKAVEIHGQLGEQGQGQDCTGPAAPFWSQTQTATAKYRGCHL